jgi:hypothetical protein
LEVWRFGGLESFCVFVFDTLTRCLYFADAKRQLPSPAGGRGVGRGLTAPK